MVVLDECHIAPAARVGAFLQGLRTQCAECPVVSLTATLLREGEGFGLSKRKRAPKSGKGPKRAKRPKKTPMRERIEDLVDDEEDDLLAEFNEFPTVSSNSASLNQRAVSSESPNASPRDSAAESPP